MPRPMSEKDQFRDIARAPGFRRAPRCKAVTAARYRATFGISDIDLEAPKREAAKFRRFHREVVRSLGSEPSTDPRTPAPIRCERYLLYAVAAWLTARVETDDSLASYLSSFRRWCADSDRRTLDRQLETTYRDIGRWLDAVEVGTNSPRTPNRHSSVLRSWFSWLADQHHAKHGYLLARTPWRKREHLRRVDRARVLRPGGRRQSLSLADAQKVAAWALAASTRPDKGLAVLLMMCAGLRRHEVVAVEKKDFSYREGAWHLMVRGKGRKSRLVRLESPVVSALSNTFRGTTPAGRVFARKGESYSRETIARWVAEAVGTVGRPEITPHDLRRTNATLLRDGGAALEQVQGHLGHSSSETTKDCYDTADRPLTTTTGIEVP